MPGASPFMLLAAAIAAGALQDSEPTRRPALEVGPIAARPGEKISGLLEVPEGTDAGTAIPVTIVHGVRPGPVLAVLAGVHGYEYPPITALQKIRRDIDAEALSGAVILVHIANLPSFLGRTIYYSPVDGKNLNRVFPGKPGGTQSERIAYTLTVQVIEKADYVLDLHGGDGNEALRPYSYWMTTGDASLDEKSRELALAFGLDHIVIDTDRPREAAAAVYAANTALTRGKPALTAETGQLGSNDPRWVEMAERGIWNVLRHLGMVKGEAAPPPAVVWLDAYEVVRSPATGIFEPATRDGYVVAEGALLGRLLDYFGEPIQQIRAPFAGVVNYVIATPPIREGEPLAMIARIQARDPSGRE